MWPADKVYDWGVVTDYYSLPVIHEIQMHGGVTFCEKKDHPKMGRSIRVGCDYSHLGDEGMRYSLQDILWDVKRSIDLFHAECLYKVLCNLFGKFYFENEGEYFGEDFRSFEGREEWKAKYPESARF